MKENDKNIWRVLGSTHSSLRTEIIQWICDYPSNIIPYLDLSNMVYSGIHKTGSSIAFPVGISVNEIAAHDTAFQGDTRTFNKTIDFVKIDWGIHQNGKIIDSAFTWNPKLCGWDITDEQQVCLEMTREMAKVISENAKVDIPIYDLSSLSQEIAESYDEAQIIPELCGHNIAPWKIHGDYMIPCSTLVPSFFIDNPRIKDGDICAVEIFTAQGTKNPRISMKSLEETNHFAWKIEKQSVPRLSLSPKAKEFQRKIIRTQDVRLPWTFSFLKEQYTPMKQITRMNHPDIIRELFEKNYIEAYPPVYSKLGCITFQWEDTIMINEKSENLTGVFYDEIFK